MLKHELLYVVLQEIEVRGRGERCLHLMKHANSSKDGSGKREKPVNELARKADFGGVLGGGIGNGGGCGDTLFGGDIAETDDDDPEPFR